MALLITFSGLDGAGKTTQIKMLQSQLESRGHRFNTIAMYDDISLAARFRKRWDRGGSPSPTTVAARTENPRADPPVVSATTKRFRMDKNRDEITTVALRGMVYLLDLFYFYAFARRRSMRDLDVLVMDRYFYDSLANLVSARDFTAHYVRAFKRLLPKPDIAILLLVAPEVAFQRKPEYPLEYMQRRESAYRKVFEGVPNSLLLDGSEDPECIHRRITREIDQLTSNGRSPKDARNKYL